MIMLAIDAMGGDDAPAFVVRGALKALSTTSDLNLTLYGDEKVIQSSLNDAIADKKFLRGTNKSTLSENRIKIVHTSDIVSSDMKPSDAVRKAKNSSMALAIDAANDGSVHGVVSAGNTGALMALSLLRMRTLQDVERPAIATVIPSTFEHESVVLDLGANAECSSQNLVQFGILGHVFAKAVLHKQNPKVALLNIGSENLKGNATVQKAHQYFLQHDLKLNYTGFVEGDAILNGKSDVIVTDGFSGNVALKTLEGTVSAIKQLAENEIKSSMLAKIGALFMLPKLKTLKKRLDPRRYNGALLIGLNGICVKSHGGADSVGFYYAIMNTYEIVKDNFLQEIKSHLEIYHNEQEADKQNEQS